jgi:alkane 1-monooxygenase
VEINSFAPEKKTVLKDLKYLLAYVVPLSAIPGLLWQGRWAWFSVILLFGIVPIVELLAPRHSSNIPADEEETRSKRLVFDLLLYANALILFGAVFAYLELICAKALTWPELIGLTLSIGIIVGSNGINVAHELGHRNNVWEQHLSKLMLLPALYQHFFVEHNRGHHKHVATDKDPASARLGDIVFAFWVRSVFGSWTSAWSLEAERLKRESKSFWHHSNLMLRFSVYQSLWLGGVFWIWGTAGFLGAVAVAVVGFLLLETVNYIEHYGLRRKQLDSGYYEPVTPAHSWNSNHEVGRILLYELTRHSDHHYKATRKYQILRHIDISPQLPFGYPTSILLALVPPLWFRIMNKRVKQIA